MFMQEQLSPPPKPKRIKHVVFDADDTIWEIEPWNIASMVTPIGKTDGNILPIELDVQEAIYAPEVSAIPPMGHIKLDSTLRNTLEALKRKGISASIASLNDKKAVERFLSAFGLSGKFVEVEAWLSGDKSTMVKEIAKKQKLNTEDILFVDDAHFNAADVSANTDATSVVMGYNIATIADILEYIE